MNVQINTTTSALYNAAYGVTTLDRSVFEASEAVSRIEACLALSAGYLAAEANLTPAQAQAKRDAMIDKAADIYAKAKPGSKNAPRSTRSAAEQALYMKANAKYLYYFSEGKASKAGKAGKAGKATSTGHTDKKARLAKSATAMIHKYSKAELRSIIALLQAAL
jgi:hypothetical protein